MIIEWSVENFGSFSDVQKISCEANTDSSLRDSNVFEIGGKGIEGVVKSVAILGRNGSGKTHLLNALAHIQGIAIKGVRDGGTEQYLSGGFSHKKNIPKALPSRVEVVVLVDEIKYHYGVTICHWGTIVEEFLNVYITAKPQKWFHKRVIYNSEGEFLRYEYESCVKLKGDKSVWEKATNSTELFLAKASKLGSKQLFPFYDWLCNKLVFVGEECYSEKLRKNREYKGVNELCRFLGLPYGYSDEQLIDDSFKSFRATKYGKVVPFFWEGESEADLALLDFAIILLDVFRQGKTLVADSFFDKLHPITICKILQLFHNSAINTKKSQLLFTTHHVSLLDQKLLRRDQIWFIEKEYESAPYMENGQSELHRLTEFSPRKTDNIARNYLAGEYGAIPEQGDISSIIACI